MNEDNDKILIRALFLLGKDAFDSSVCQDQESFRSLMMALFAVIYPDLKAWTVDGDHRIHFSDPTGPPSTRTATASRSGGGRSPPSIWKAARRR